MSTSHQVINQNTVGYDYIIGDIHGKYTELMKLLEKNGFNFDTDRLFSCGDFTNKGEESMKMLEAIKEPWFYPVIGNHEETLLFAQISDNHFNDWISIGGNWLTQKDLKTRSIKQLLSALSSTPRFITLQLNGDQTIGICHAQPPTDNWADIENNKLTARQVENAIWSRSRFGAQHFSNTFEPIRNISLTIHGHIPVESPTLLANSLYIDTRHHRDNNEFALINLTKNASTIIKSITNSTKHINPNSFL